MYFLWGMADFNIAVFNVLVEKFLNCDSIHEIMNNIIVIDTLYVFSIGNFEAEDFLHYNYHFSEIFSTIPQAISVKGKH